MSFLKHTCLLGCVIAAVGSSGCAEATAAAPPYARSSVIRSVTWAPATAIVRRARGSDNWPMTWANDDFLYTAYGDGRGFKPFVDRKLSLGIARVAGTPGGPLGINVRCPSAEQIGDGAKGRKASGMLMVNGVLYMWVRNAANSQLAWSRNHGQS